MSEENKVILRHLAEEFNKMLLPSSPNGRVRQ